MTDIAVTPDAIDAVRANRLLNTQEIRDGRVVLQSKPLQINIELMGMCNIVPPCLFCTGKNFGHDYPPLDVSYLDQYSHFISVCEKINEDSFGEPLMHPKLPGLIEEVTGRGQRFTFVTNGLLLNRRRADQLAACGPLLGIHISVNASTADTYFKLHGKKFDRLIENIVYYVSTYQQMHNGRSPDLTLTFIVMRINRGEVADFLAFAQRLGVKSLLAPLHNRPSIPLGQFGYDFVYENEMLSAADYRALSDELVASGTAVYLS